MAETCKTLAEYKHYCDRERAAGNEPAVLMLDNDQAAAYDDEHGVDIFDTDPYTLIRQALDLLGIPHDEV